MLYRGSYGACYAVFCWRFWIGFEYVGGFWSCFRIMCVQVVTLKYLYIMYIYIHVFIAPANYNSPFCKPMVFRYTGTMLKIISGLAASLNKNNYSHGYSE